VLIALVTVVKEGRHFIFPKRFFEVVPGRIYRSGYLEQGPLRRVIDQHGLKTVLALLNDEPEDPDQQRENRILAEKGVKLIRIGMPGNGLADFDLLDQAATMLADASTHPVLVHCSAGVNRTGAVVAAWRMKYCGWDPDRAIDEAQRCGWSPWKNPELRDHLREYHRTRVASSQPASAASRPAA